jgi:tetratricopeptide (TPR) repeat protein
MRIETDGITMASRRNEDERSARNDDDSKSLGARKQVHRPRRLRWFWIALAVGIGAAINWELGRTPVSSSPPDVPVDAAQARRQGIALYEQGRYAEAKAAYERALAVEDDAATHIDLGNALKKLDRADDAESQYRLALAKDPRNATGWFDLGNLLRDQRHDVRGAVEAFRHATELDPQMAVASFSLGAALIDLRDYEAAIAALETALQTAPENVSWRTDAQNALSLAHVRYAEKKGQLPPAPHK